MFKTGDFILLRHPAGLDKRGWKGARVARVVDPNEFPELRKELLEDILGRGLPEETLEEMVAVRWADTLPAVDGFYHSGRFVPISSLAGTTEQEDEEGNSHGRSQTTLN